MTKAELGELIAIVKTRRDELWFDRGVGTAYTVRMDFQMIPANALNYGISAEMTEMAKKILKLGYLIIIK